jgi:hypothetical protein
MPRIRFDACGHSIGQGYATTQLGLCPVCTKKQEEAFAVLNEAIGQYHCNKWSATWQTLPGTPTHVCPMDKPNIEPVAICYRSGNTRIMFAHVCFTTPMSDGVVVDTVRGSRNVTGDDATEFLRLLDLWVDAQEGK